MTGSEIIPEIDAEASAERGTPIGRDAAREIVHGMPAAEWKARYQGEASEARIRRMKQSVAKNA